MTAIIPPGEVAWGFQLPIQSQSTTYVQPWEVDAGPAELADIVRAADRGRRVLRGGVRPHRHPPPGGRDDVRHVVRHGGHPGVDRGHHRLGPPAEPRVRPAVPPSPGHGQGVQHPRRPVGGPGGARGRCRAPAERVRDAGRGPRQPRRGAGVRAGADPVRVRGELPGGRASVAPTLPVGMSPRPARPGGPPIWIGGSSPAAIRRAAQFGDGWLPQGPPEMGTRAAMARIRELRAEAGLPAAFDMGVNCAPVHLDGSNAEEVAEGLRRFAGAGDQPAAGAVPRRGRRGVLRPGGAVRRRGGPPSWPADPGADRDRAGRGGSARTGARSCWFSSSSSAMRWAMPFSIDRDSDGRSSSRVLKPASVDHLENEVGWPRPDAVRVIESSSATSPK